MVIDLTSVLFSVLSWVAATAIIALALNHQLQHNRLSPYVWWIGLGISFLVFVPAPDTIVGQFGTPFLGRTIRDFQAPDIEIPPVMGVDASALDFYIETCTLAIMVLISLWRVYTLSNNYRRMYRLVSHSVPYNSENCHSPVYLTSLKNSAFVVGFFRPIIALPDYFYHYPNTSRASYSPTSKRTCSRRTTYPPLAWRTIGELFWFNPFLGNLEKASIKVWSIAVTARPLLGITLKRGNMRRPC